MEKELISVIVSIYNVEKYLSRCIESILNQTYINLEVILVDDGSTDDCGILCDEYKKKDDRIVVVHKANGGLSSARNAGLDIASGNLISFVDSDDYLENTFFEELIINMKKYSSDIAICSYNVLKYNSIETFMFNDIEFCLTDKYKFINLQLRYRSLTISAWNKLYKRELFENLRYPVGKIYEDLYIICDLLDRAKVVSYILKPLYNYFYRDDSISHKFTINQFDNVDSSNVGIDFYNKKGYYDLEIFEKNIKALKIINYLSMMKIHNIYNQNIEKKYYKDLIDTCKSLKWRNLNNTVKLFRIIGKNFIRLKILKYKLKKSLSM